METRPLDAEYVALYHEIHKYDIPGHFYRGFIVLQSKKERKRDIKVKIASFKYENGSRRRKVIDIACKLFLNSNSEVQKFKIKFETSNFRKKSVIYWDIKEFYKKFVGIVEYI